jgi:hypothetical protein
MLIGKELYLFVVMEKQRSVVLGMRDMIAIDRSLKIYDSSKEPCHE